MTSHTIHLLQHGWTWWVRGLPCWICCSTLASSSIIIWEAEIPSQNATTSWGIQSFQEKVNVICHSKKNCKLRLDSNLKLSCDIGPSISHMKGVVRPINLDLCVTWRDSGGECENTTSPVGESKRWDGRRSPLVYICRESTRPQNTVMFFFGFLGVMGV